jgi:hypothetical protein
MEASIARDARTFVADTASGVSYLQILCIWQRGADGLLERYRQLEKSLPTGDNLETMVLTKDELMRKVRVKDEETTTHQINNICKNLAQLYQEKEIHVYIDECWITVPKKYTAHLTQVSFLL